MKKLVSLFAGCMLALLAQAQLVQVVNEAFYVGDGTIAAYPAGATTYRVYAEMADGADAVTAVYAEAGSSLLLGTENDMMWNTNFGAITGDALNTAFFAVFPESEYDSFVTIGRANTGDPGGSVTAVSVLPTNAVIDDAFGATTASQFNADLVMQDGTWFSTPDQVNTNGVGPNFRVLLAQITTVDDIEYNLNLQVLDDGIGGTQFKYVWDPAAIDTPEEVDGSSLGMSYVPSADVNGCMNATACNYNAAATIDDGSCVFATGCDECSGETDGTGTVVDNPEPGEACDDGDATTMMDTTQADCSCAGTPIVEGCTDGGACNYNPAANQDDGSCEFTSCAGCTDATACNYDPTATIDDGSCEFTSCLGCTDPAASNYDSSATTDDGSCLYAVTFNVDMNCEDPASFTTPAVESGAFGWCGGCVPMTDADMDGVWSVTVDLPLGDFEYKYAVDNFAGQEDLLDDAIAGATCVGNTDFATFANRVITVAAGAAFSDTYGSCDPCVLGSDGCTDPAASNYDGAATTDDGSCLYAVTFNVDMNCEDPASFTTPSVESPAFGWCGGCAPMSDNGDGTWTVVLDLPLGNFEYKYAVDNFAGQENLVDDMQNGASCAPITDFASYANREIAVAAGAVFNDTYGSCSPCVIGSGCTDDDAVNYDASASSDDGSCQYNVTFTVDMNNYGTPGVDFTTPEVNGSFNGWCGGCNPLSDPEGDNIWTTTLPLPIGSYDYQFAVDSWTDQEFGLDPAAPCTNGGNRFVDVVDSPVDQGEVCWELCVACTSGAGCTDSDATNYDSAATSDDGSCTYEVIFTVDMNQYGTAGVDYTTPEVNGSFNGWCGGCAPMSDPEADGVWTTTIVLGTGTWEYQFAVDSWTDQEFGLDPNAACTIGGNRFVDVVDSPVDIGEVCWESCDPCTVAVSGCTDAEACNYDPTATIDDGSCEFTSCLGCTDPAASNYDSSATTEDGSCLYAVTFNVDMNCEDPASFTTPAVESGAFGWCGGCVPMTDADMDGVWSVTVDLPLGDFEYKYAVDNFAGQEDLLDDAIAGATCVGNTDFATFANRVITVAAGAAFSDTYGSCDPCVLGSDGCTDPAASNYDGAATNDDGSCLYAVTFNVDMNCEDPASFTTPSVESPAFGWCGGCAPMSDNGDGTWTVVLDLPLGNFEYKYAVDNFAGQENLVDDMQNGASCAPITDFASYANREIAVAAGAVFNDTYGSCSACVIGSGCTDDDAVNYDASASSDDGSCQYNVTFTVDMNNYGTPGVDFTTPEVNGGFNGWCGGCNPLSDPEGDNIWTTTIPLPIGSYDYQFAVDSWTDQEFGLDPAAPCTNGGNRFVDVVDSPVDQGEVCWELCVACTSGAGCTDSDATNYDSAATSDDGSCTYEVIFTVDMNQYGTAGVDYTTPEVNGSFNGWCGGCAPMSDPEADGVWTTTIVLGAGTWEYQFAVDSWTDQEFGLDPNAACTIGGNRFVDVVDSPVDIGEVCWESCDPCTVAVSGCTDPAASNYDSAATTDDGSCVYAVTFNVDMNCEDPASFTTPAVESGAFGWCGGCVPMTDADMDGVWSVTVDLPLGDFEYKYAVDNFAGQEDLLDDAIAGATCVGNTDFATFANRVITVAAGAAFSDTYGSCDPCVLGSDGCTDPLANNYDAAATTDDGSCMYDVTLTVDMNCFDGNDPNIESGGDGTFTTPAVEGPSFGWCGSCVPMADNGDGTWSVTLQLPAGDFEYKYAHDGFAGQEQLIDDMVGGASCAPVTDFANFANRLITIPTVLSTNDVYGSCGSCAPGCTDMSACNYDAAATFDDGSCVFAAGCDTCSGESDGTGVVVDNPEVGDACDDGNPSTIDDTIQADCSCAGTDPSLPQSQLDYPAGNYDLCELIKADWISADDYRFVFDANDGGAAITYEQGAANTFLLLRDVPGLEVNTTYGVTVDALFGTSWSIGTISTDVTITAPTPFVNPSDECDAHGPHALGDYISAKPYVCGGDKWEWTFTADGQLPVVYTRNSANRFIRLSNVGGLLPGTQYDVTVRAGYPNGAFTPMSEVGCIAIIGVAPGGIAAGGPTVDADADLERTAEGTAAVAFYPNPNTGDFLNVNLMGVESPKVTLDIVNMMGANVKRIELNVAGGNVNEVISLDGLASGVYLVNTTMNGEVFTERLIIQK